MTTTFTMRIDDALKADAEELFDDIGLNFTSAITTFLKKCVAVGGIPFQLVRQSRDERLKIYLKEAEDAINDPGEPRCTDPAKLREFLLS
jgi:DNA-damage-inducible protein J